MITKENLLENKTCKNESFSIEIIPRAAKKKIFIENEFSLNPSKSFALQSNQGDQDLIYIISGIGRIRAESLTTSILKGDRVTIPRDISYSIDNTGDTPLHFLQIVLTL